MYINSSLLTAVNADASCCGKALLVANQLRAKVLKTLLNVCLNLSMKCV
jgi:hypothetical protein